MRIACLLVADLPLYAELRASPDLVGRPLVITSGPGARAEILSVSPKATQSSVRPGLTLPQARAICPEIEVRVASPILEQSARETLLDVGLSMAPRAELAGRGSGLFLSEGAVFIDAEGIEALYGSESLFASVLHARAARAGFQGFVSIAASRGVARLAARHLVLAARFAETSRLTEPLDQKTSSEKDEPAATQILPPDGEIAYLSPLPIDLLDPDDRTAEALTRFGIHRIRDLLRLPRRDLAARLGPSLLALIARARGEEEEPPLPEPRTSLLEEGQDLEAPLASLEPLGFVFRGLVSRLVERLDLRGLGCVELRCALQLENGARLSRRIGVASPCQDERILLRLLRLAIERNPPPAPVESVQLLCEGVPLRREQLDLFIPRGPSPSALDETLAELGSICGEDRIGTPEIVDDHRPNAFALKPFRPRKNVMGASKRSRASKRKRPASDRRQKATIPSAPPQRRGPRLTIRALRPPMPADVRLAQGHPVHLRSAITRGEILNAAGPWRSTGHWWSKTAHFAVDHYDIQMRDGSVLRICFDWKVKRWQVDGVYD